MKSQKSLLLMVGALGALCSVSKGLAQTRSPGRDFDQANKDIDDWVKQNLPSAPSPKPRATPTPSQKANSQSGAITYNVVKEWPLGKIIVVPAASRKDKAGLIALLQQIARADSAIRQIRVWDDSRAKKLQEGGGSLSKTEEDFVSRHFVGLYERHHVTGKETFLYYATGGDNDEGTPIDITGGSASTK